MIKLLDCTLRDGGYYNDWDYAPDLISDYLSAMQAINVDYIEIGLRSLKNDGFKGGCAYSKDSFLQSLKIPEALNGKIGVMVNASELLSEQFSIEEILQKLFSHKKESLVSLVRVACHLHEFEACLPAAIWLNKQGYTVGFNVMQITEKPMQEITDLALKAKGYPIDVLYFADSMGSLNSETTSKIIRAFKRGWAGELGIHTHDSMGQALANSLSAVDEGVTWVDATVTGMGRGPGNVQTEYLTIALAEHRNHTGSIPKLLELIHKYFKPMKNQYGWGTNPYYYLAGQYSIHPSYVQEMLADSRYKEEDILSVIEHLKITGGKKFNLDTLESARHFFSGKPKGSWQPKNVLADKIVLILGSGPGVSQHKKVIEDFIQDKKPYVIALNTQQSVSESLIDIRAACHPLRLLADCHEYIQFPQPLVTPVHMLPNGVQEELSEKNIYDFGLEIIPEVFSFDTEYCTLPSSLVIAYALAIATSGLASRILLAGFDGYSADDPRRQEIDSIFHLYQKSEDAIELLAITPTKYDIPVASVYGLIK
mgnify:CR=1 FL=1